MVCGSLIDDFESPEGRARIARLRDAYLEPWTEHSPGPALRELFDVALWLSHSERALNWNHHLKDADNAARAEWQPRVVYWLRRWRDRRALFLGWRGGSA